MTAERGKHVPVLLEEVLRYLNPEGDEKYLDGTFGGGGHTRAILEAAPEVRVWAIDRDPAAVARAEALGDEFGERFTFCSLNFGSLDKLEEREFSGILLDIGLSSFQLDDPKRGFSFRVDEAIDMRMDTTKGVSASEFLETVDERKLVRAIRNLGEEKAWKRVVRAIMGARGTDALARTGAFANLVKEAIGPPRGKPSRIHPATKAFQGIRMAVNDELGELEAALPIAFDKLEVGGVLVIISFHSLEDRLVKRFYRRLAGQAEHRGDNLPQDLRERYGRILTPRPVVPQESEIGRNPRSRSAKLRVIQKERHRDEKQ